jgi:aspartyl-tRNA(Asn)/glutamyl-tRNA(Gln) amidotransferase subunit B
VSWETVIGLEVHVQLLTRSKMFCGCSAHFGDPPNTNVCPVCLGLPGALPVPNEQAVRLAVRAALALGCTVHRRSIFARKNYFYPDLPKGYQISQFEEPLATGGTLGFASAERGPVQVRIKRLHLEEDAGKSFHDRVPGKTAVDFNRSGVPLVEIVSEPDLRSPAEARAYLTVLKQVLGPGYVGVSNCNMEEGSLRVDANLSIRPAGSSELRTRTEVKNMNSFSGVERALGFERDRQIAATERGEAIEQRTMTFDAASGEVRPMRSKEESHDYRYFPEPDIPPLVLTEAWLATERTEVRELPGAKRERFERDYHLSGTEAVVVTASAAVADYFEALVAAGEGTGKEAWNWVANDLLSLSSDGQSIPLPVERAGEVARLVKAGAISRQAAKRVLSELLGHPDDAALATAERLGLVQVSDAAAIEGWVRETLAAHPSEVERYQAGETKLMGFLVGQVMKRSKGKADPKAVNAALAAAVGKRSLTR